LAVDVFIFLWKNATTPVNYSKCNQHACYHKKEQKSGMKPDVVMEGSQRVHLRVLPLLQNFAIQALNKLTLQYVESKV